METQNQPTPAAEGQPPESGSDPPAEEALARPGWHAVSRGVAIFVGGFALVQMFGEMQQPAASADFWWLDLRPCPPPVARGAVALAGTLMVLFGVWPRLLPLFRGLGIVGTAILLFFAARGVATYYLALRQGEFTTDFPVPFDLHISACLVVILAGLLSGSKPSGRPVRTFVLILIAIGVCAVGFPLAHLYCVGKIDFRRQADAVVVFGHPAPADVDATAARELRVQTACELVKSGLAQKLILLAGPGGGHTDDMESMRRQALELGVPPPDIVVGEEHGGIWASVEFTSVLLKRHNLGQVLVVSHFYQLPRIRLYYRRLATPVWTVPAGNGTNTGVRWQLIGDEIISLWTAYLDALRP